MSKLQGSTFLISLLHYLYFGKGNYRAVYSSQTGSSWDNVSYEGKVVLSSYFILPMQQCEPYPIITTSCFLISRLTSLRATNPETRILIHLWSRFLFSATVLQFFPNINYYRAIPAMTCVQHMEVTWKMFLSLRESLRHHKLVTVSRESFSSTSTPRHFLLSPTESNFPWEIFGSLSSSSSHDRSSLPSPFPKTTFIFSMYLIFGFRFFWSPLLPYHRMFSQFFF